MLDTWSSSRDSKAAHLNSLIVIQLVEVPAPPKNFLASESSSYYWSSDSDSSSSHYSEDDEEYESYCSSGSDQEVVEDGQLSAKMSRVVAWRTGSDSAYGEDDDELKNFRNEYGISEQRDSETSSEVSSTPSRPIPFSSRTHICPACDASFSTLEQLQRHAAKEDEACQVAIQYGFES